MRGSPETPFPFPPQGDAFIPFPERVPWEAPIWSLPWWLRVTCSCRPGPTDYPLRLMAAQIGWRVTLRQVIPRLRCKTCGARPVEVILVDETGGDVGRYGAKEKRLRLV